MSGQKFPSSGSSSTAKELRRKGVMRGWRQLVEGRAMNRVGFAEDENANDVIVGVGNYHEG